MIKLKANLALWHNQSKIMLLGILFQKCCAILSYYVRYLYKNVKLSVRVCTMF